MDGQRFDQLTRALASSGSRRGFLKTVLAGAGAMLFVLPAEVADAAQKCSGDRDCAGLEGSTCVRKRCRCPQGFKVCGDTCVDVQNDNFSCGRCRNNCGLEGLCRDGRCTCDGPGLKKCDGKCVDLQTDLHNCGKCGSDALCALVGSRSICVDGVPAPAPSAGSSVRPAFCDGVCVDLAGDQDHCGECGNKCPRGIGCIAGSCEECPTGQFVCKGASGCHDFGSDPDHCNGCFKQCPAGGSCVNHACQCPSGTVSCKIEDGQACVDISSDFQNCGKCGNACVTGEVCTGGACVCVNSSDTKCEFCCADLQTDLFNCGACGRSALCGIVGATSACINGEPAPRPANGSSVRPAFCDGKCLDTASDRRNCGACGNKCASGKVCRAGACACKDESNTLCGDSCVDVSKDHDNCGACGHSCGDGLVCRGGVCACRDESKSICGEACFDLQTDTVNCGACRKVCLPAQQCRGGQCIGCTDGRPPCNETCCSPGQVCTGGVCTGCAGVREVPTAQNPCCPTLVESISSCDSGGNYCLQPQTTVNQNGSCNRPPNIADCRDACDCSGGSFACVQCVSGMCILNGGSCTGQNITCTP